MITKVVWGGVVQAPYVCYGMDNGPGRPNDAMSVASFTEALVGLGGYPQPRDLVFRVYNSVYNIVLEKGTPVGVVYRAQGPALGSWGDWLPAA